MEGEFRTGDVVFCRFGFPVYGACAGDINLESVGSGFHLHGLGPYFLLEGLGGGVEGNVGECYHEGFVVFCILDPAGD